MKRILIISEEDVAGLRLIELYNALFSNEHKELYYCSIHIVDCYTADHLYAPISPTTQPSGIKSASLPKLMRGTRPHKTLHANSCDQILKIISEHNINAVIVPSYLYDPQRSAQYHHIIKEIKKINNVDFIGLYI